MTNPKEMVLRSVSAHKLVLVVKDFDLVALLTQSLHRSNMRLEKPQLLQCTAEHLVRVYT